MDNVVGISILPPWLQFEPQLSSSKNILLFHGFVWEFFSPALLPFQHMLQTMM